MIASEGDAECEPDWFTGGLILGGSCAFGIACIGAVFINERMSINAKMKLLEEVLLREAAGGSSGSKHTIQIAVSGSFQVRAPFMEA